jgi:apolipoprotein N-acyltransferase
MVRAANTGVTCIVNEFGRVNQILKDDAGSTFSEGVLIGEVNVPITSDLTFYLRHGEVFAQFCTGVTLVALLSFATRSVLTRRAR